MAVAPGPPTTPSRCSRRFLRKQGPQDDGPAPDDGARRARRTQGHFTADDVHDRLRDAGERVSLATVYRALSLLEEAGILEGHDFDDGQRRYERALTREHHDHLICLDCRAVVEFQNAAIEDAPGAGARASTASRWSTTR